LVNSVELFKSISYFIVKSARSELVRVL